MIKEKGISSKVLKTALYGLYLFLIVFILLEITLRMYNPFGFRLKADRIILPVNQKQIIKNTINPRLDSIIVNTRNSLGLRGPEKPPDFEKDLTIITVGGSTTECHFLNDDKTWTFRLGELLKRDFRNLWLNNAGLDGHSTYGHMVLLNDHLVHIKPKVIIFLTGANDIENDGPTFHDKLNTKGAYSDLIHYIYNESEVVNLGTNFIRGSKARKLNNTTQALKLPGENGSLELAPEQIKNRMRKQSEFLSGYDERIRRLIDTCIQHDILPVFMSQPCLYGYGIDSVTKADLATARVEDSLNGLLLWKIFQAYNAKLRMVCIEKNVPFIDLASRMPKNSVYYYDQTHYTNEGAVKVAEIAAENLRNIFRITFPDFLQRTN